MFVQIRWPVAIGIMTISKYCCPRFAPLSLILAATVNLTFLQLLHRGFFGDHETDQVREDVQYISNLIFLMMLNYNTFLTTLFTIPIITMTNIVLTIQIQLKEQDQIFSQTTGKPLSEEERNQ